ncbi:MAG: HisA/HisF-related TIM barrel protein, partial [Gemmatimonadaceae bacterium]
MKVVPAVDLRGGRCVQLVGGSYDQQAIERDDPAAVAVQWESDGFACLHVVDLDAATGRGSNGDIVGQILDSVGMKVQVGGGIRSTDSVQYMLNRGAAKVVVGTRAIEDHDWAASISRQFPGAIVVAADVRGRTVVTRGWDGSGDRGIEEELAYFNTLPLGGLLVTAVHV